MRYSTPLPPPDAVTGDNPLRRVHFRLWQIVSSAVTVAVTVWLFTINPIVGIVASFIAKHVLVAILASGLTPPKSQPPLVA